MKTIKKILLLFAALLPIVSCNNKEEADGPAELKVDGISPDSENIVFEYGETKEWTVHTSNVASVQVSFPQGWKATADLSKLAVTAPEEADADYVKGGYVILSYTSTSGDVNKFAFPVGLVMPELTFDIKVEDVTSISAKFTVTPSDETMGYYFDITRKADFDSKNGDVADIVENVIKIYHQQQPGIPIEELLKIMIEYGTKEEEIDKFSPDTELVIFAIGLDESGQTYGTPAYEVFKTSPPGKPEDCKFEFEIKDLRATSFKSVVKPSDRSIRYWYSVEDFANWKGDQPVFADVKNTLKSYAEQNGMTIEDVVAGVTNLGILEEEWGDRDGIAPGTDYYIYAYAMDESGDPAGPMFKHKFTTRNDDLSMAEVKTSYQYFDGDALYEYDSQKYPNAQGKVLVQVAAGPANPYTVDWFITLAGSKYMDDVTYPDDATKNAMIQWGAPQGDNRQQFWIPDGFHPCTLLSFGLDEYGIDGLLKRELLDLKKEGAESPDKVAPMQTSMCGLPFMVDKVSVSRELSMKFQPVYVRASQMQF